MGTVHQLLKKKKTVNNIMGFIFDLRVKCESRLEKANTTLYAQLPVAL